MTLKSLEYFKKLAELQHFTKAANELHISQPSLSYAISELEKDLEIPLFDRKDKKITLLIIMVKPFFLMLINLYLS